MKDTITIPIAFIDKQIDVAEHNWNVAYGRDKDYYKGVKDTPEELKRLFAEESKMEKTYEKALANIGDVKFVSGYDEENGEDEYTYVSCSFKYGEDIALLENAIDKAHKYDEMTTPKFIEYLETVGEGIERGFCPHCHCSLLKKKYEAEPRFCENCGHAIKWK